jgi:hypothetical protein
MPKFTSIFTKPEGGVYGGLATALAVVFIYRNALPSHADIRTGDSNNTDIESARRSAAITSTALVGLVFLITRDLNTFILSGATVAGLDYVAKHHNAINPQTGRLDTSSGVDNTMSHANVFSLPDYGAANG